MEKQGFLSNRAHKNNKHTWEDWSRHGKNIYLISNFTVTMRAWELAGGKNFYLFSGSHLLAGDTFQNIRSKLMLRFGMLAPSRSSIKYKLKNMFSYQYLWKQNSEWKKQTLMPKCDNRKTSSHEVRILFSCQLSWWLWNLKLNKYFCHVFFSLPKSVCGLYVL